LRNILCPNAAIKRYEKKNPCHQDKIELCVYDSQMCRDLGLWNIVPNKVKILVPPKNLPLDLIHHFIRGLFDGDGSVYFTKGSKYITKRGEVRFSKNQLRASVTGTKEMMQWVDDNFWKFYFHDCKVEENRGTYQIRYGSKTAKKFLQYIYRNSTLYMERKYEKSRDFLL